MTVLKISNQQMIKGKNIKGIFQLVTVTSGISRAKLSRLTNLSKATVSVLVDELISTGFIIDEGIATSAKQGRRPNRLKINVGGKVVIVFNWLEGIVEGRVVCLDGSIVAEEKFKTTDKIDYVKKTEEIFNRLKATLKSGVDILGVCIISPSAIRVDQLQLISTMLPLDIDQPVIHNMRSAIPEVALAFFNDTACFAYGEVLLDHQLMGVPTLFINLNKGIGAIAFSEGKILGGASGSVTEFGHLSVQRYGERCRCGNRGCLENLVGEAAIAKRALECKLPGYKSGAPLTYRDLGEGLSEGAPGYREFSGLLAEDLAYAISNFITLHSVDQVIIGGKGQYLGEDFLDILKSKLAGYYFRGRAYKIAVGFSRANPSDKIEFAGAAKYFIDTHFSFVNSINNKIFLE